MYQLNPASLDIEKNDKPIIKKNNAKTYKNKKTVNFSDEKTKINNISNMLSKLNSDSDDDDSNNFKNDYNKLFNSNNNTEHITYSTELNNNNEENQYMSMLNTSYTNLNDGYKNNYDYLNIKTNNNILDENNKLLSKLEYITHLLEQQHNEKTNHLTEELILYLFLGIFIIFVLDSFARASKYVR